MHTSHAHGHIAAHMPSRQLSLCASRSQTALACGGTTRGRAQLQQGLGHRNCMHSLACTNNYQQLSIHIIQGYCESVLPVAQALPVVQHSWLDGCIGLKHGVQARRWPN